MRLTGPDYMEDSFNKVIDLLYWAKQDGVEVFLNDHRLQIKVAENKIIDEKLLQEIRENKQQILEYLSNDNWQVASVNNHSNKINPYDRQSITKIPLSFSQERLWFIDQLEGSVQYHSPTILRLKGNVNIAALENALRTVVARHEILRTIFREEEGNVYQSVKEQDDWMLSQVRGDAFTNDRTALLTFISDLIKAPFDLSGDYPVRGTLVTLSPKEHILIVTLHHIASDAWSTSIIVKEVVELYNSFAEGRRPNLPLLPLQFSDYAVWQRNYLKGDVLSKKISYWKQKLEGLAPLQLPTDFPRPSVRGSKGAAHAFRIEKTLSAQLQQLSRQEGASMFMVLLSAFKVLLYRYSAQEDIGVGTSIASRQQKELEGLIGFFVNTLTLRDQVKGTASFKELLRQVKATTLEAYEHQELPFEKVVENVVTERDMSRSPLFQVMLVLQNTPEASKLKLGDVELSGESIATNISKFDITLFVNETAEGLLCYVEYSTDLYTAPTIQRMMTHFQFLLSSIVKDPQQQIGLIPLIAREEEQQLLEVFNEAGVIYPKNKSVIDLFEEQVAVNPDHTALVFEREALTYKILNERANQLAHHLLSLGVQKDELVPLFIDRSATMLVAMLGIMKAGAAYVPIDTDFPEERIRYMLEDTGAVIVVAKKESADKLPTAGKFKVLTTDDDVLLNQPVSNPATKPSANQLAYVIYTSGSTGKPKGAMIEHRNLLDYYYGLNAGVQVGECKSFALVSTIATDLGNTVIYASLLSGGSLHVFSKESVSNIEYLHDYFSENKIDCLKIVPSHWKALSDDGNLLLPKKLLVFGGEALQSELVEEIRFSGRGCRIVNHYGPTETTIGKLLHEVKTGNQYSKTIPIGRPFSNTKVYVLSGQLQLCPVGIPGQLYIAGDGVARGYYNNENLTSEKFISNPFSTTGESMYATGDLVKWLTDGNIEFIGRVDDQVKIRGYRVELGEIESILQQSEQVAQAVVLARDDKQGNKRLVGYIVPTVHFDKPALNNYLKATLPEYMVPAVLIELETLPLTANGKVDRKALPDPDSTSTGDDAFAAPRDEAEMKMAAIWEDILEVEKVGIHDDFFELGGHSLLAVRLISAIRKAFAIEMPIGDIFDFPTVALLTAQLPGQSAKTVLLPITKATPVPERIPLSFSQERLWFIDQLGGSQQYHIPSVLRLQGDLDKTALQQALRQIIQRHEVLRSVILQEDGIAYQQVQEADPWQMQVIDGSSYLADQAGLQQYIKQCIDQPFNLSTDYMVRITLIGLQDTDHVLVVALHHMASDGWSNTIIVKELVELYNAISEGRNPILPALPIQYADFAIWQRNYLQGSVLEEKLGYWQKKLQGVSPLQFPTDFPRPPVQSTNGATVGFNLGQELSEGLERVSKQQGTTIFMTLLSVINVLLYRYTGQRDICVGTPVAGRQQEEVEGLIGFFINTLALRTGLAADHSFKDVLQQVKATTLEAYAHQEVPFEKVVEAVVQERDMSRSPLFQVMLVLQNTPDADELKLGQLQLSRMQTGASRYNKSKFDLTFNLIQTANGIQGAIEFCTDLFSEATILVLIQHLQQLIRSAIAEPQQAIKSLQMLSAAQQQQLLEDFNGSKAIYRTGESVISLFEEQVAKTPGKLALVFGEEQMNYQQLNERSNHLAHHLKGKGVAAESRVLVCLERSANFLVAVIGILKSGAAYVPVDPAYPTERLRFLFEDSGASLVVSNYKNIAALQEAGFSNIIDIDADVQVSTASTNNPETAILPGHLAYVIYTSGTTGKPKGVMIEHGNLLAYLVNDKTNYIDTEGNNTGSFIHLSFTFDASLTAMFMPLLSGKAVVIASVNTADVFEDNNFQKYAPYDFIKITPSHLEMLAPAFKGRNGQQVTKKLVIGGEALLLSQFDPLITDGIDLAIVNEYGPTEATVGCSVYSFNLSNTTELTGNNIPIGKPIDNVEIYIVGEGDQLVPIGVSGELCISGEGVARGYLNRSELTADKFADNPFNVGSGSKMYRTGDIAKWKADGNIEYIGRKDEQVKINGYRIEPGEVESVLQQYPGINQAIVLAKSNKNDSKRLVAYVVPAEDFSQAAVIQYLGQKLPEYMIPVQWFEMNNFPLTINGKIDKNALSALDGSELPGHIYEAPRNLFEAKLADTWQQLLKVERLSIHDNFFELGGHSLLAMRMVSAVRKELEIEMPIKAVFSHPTVASLAAHLQQEVQGSAAPAIVPQPRTGLLPLSFSQERLWFIDQLGGSLQYHSTTVLRLNGDLDRDALSGAFKQIVNRHEVLRTVIRDKDGVAYQHIKTPDEWTMDIVDGSNYIENRQGLLEYVKQYNTIAFNLAEDYMLRAALICLSKSEFVLVATLHHIASDAWSNAIMVNELTGFYNGYVKKRPAAFSPLAVQYADFAIWQRHYLQGEILEQKLNYWVKKLDGVTPLQLATDFPRPTVLSTSGAVKWVGLDKDLSVNLRSLSQQHGATLFMTMLAAVKALLYRYSGQQDICIGTPIAGRQQQELEGMIGFFINTLALRTSVDGDASFKDLLHQVRATTLDAYTHQDMPFEKVVDAVVKDRDMSRSPLFQVMLVLQNAPGVKDMQLEGLQIGSGVEGSYTHNTTKFELTFNITDSVEGLQVFVEYCTDLFSGETIERMLTHFTSMLHAIVNDPLQSVDLLPMLTNEESRQLLLSFNDNDSLYPGNKSIVEIFEEQVAAQPGKTAVSFGNKHLSYQQLDEQSSQLANSLQSLGVKQETMVAVCMGKTLEMMVAILGILKAGAAYVPIDINYPAERIAFMLEDIGATILVTNKECSEKLSGFSLDHIIELDDENTFKKIDPAIHSKPVIAPDHLAYVMYTSGSTGKPKGVLVSHRNVVSLVKGVDYVSLGDKDNLLSTGSPAFDATTFEYWSMLLNGGQLVLISEEALLDSQSLKAEIRNKAVTIMWFTAGWFNQLVETAIDIFAPLKTVLVGGEKLSEYHIQIFSANYPAIQLINGYGPTENTTFSLTYPISRQQELPQIPIGRPLNNRRAYILDKSRQLVPVGVPGEIFLGGAGLSKGYLNQPVLTKEKFIQLPFIDNTVYSTGDVGRWLADGNIEYLGRVDEQVKIRGYRVEPGEIENVLQQSGLVKQAVVLVQVDQQQVKRLAAYIVPQGIFNKEAIQAYAKTTLPDYMLPALWTSLEKLPLTANGKIDKKALPLIAAGEQISNEFVAPQSELEKNLAGIWGELLGVDKVGIHDNFFELGGDSILTIQVVSRARRMGYELQPKDIFLHQNIGSLAAAIAQRSAEVISGEQGILTGAAGLLPIQQWYFDHAGESVSHFNQSVVLGIDKSVSAASLGIVITKLIEQHDALRFRYYQSNGAWIQEYGNHIATLKGEDLRGAEQASLGTLIRDISDRWQKSLNLETGELVQVVWIQMPEEEKQNRLLFVIHHLAVDGVSWRILIENFEFLLTALHKDQVPDPGPKSSSYRQWYNALEQYGRRRDILAQVDYWENIINNFRPFAIDKPTAATVRLKDISSRSVILEPEQTARLLKEVPKAYHTEINDILLCALAISLGKWGSTNSITVGLEGHGREDISDTVDISRTVGWFTNLYPVLIQVTETFNIADTIKSVKEQLRKVPAKGLGYGVLKYIHKEPRLSGVSRWNVVFNYLGQLDTVVKSGTWLSGAGESSGQTIADDYLGHEQLSLSGSVKNGQLTLNWRYNSSNYDAAAMSDLVDLYKNTLNSLIDHCVAQQLVETVFTPSDFGLEDEISFNELDAFLTEPFNGKRRIESLEGLYRLSGLQQGMLFHGIFNQQAGTYIEQFNCDLLNPNLPLFIQSWENTLRQHSILRSAFYYDVFDVPVQCVYKEVTLPVTVLDFRDLNPVEREAELKAYEDSDRTKGFDFKTAPLMRVSLLRLSDDRYRMLWTSHHILFDGWSLPILMEEFLSSYELLLAGKALDSGKQDRYEDYIRYIERSDKEQEIGYWKSYMQGVSQSTLLPFIPTHIERTRGRGNYDSRSINLDKDITEKIKLFAQSKRLTVNTLMQGVWSFLLHTYTGQPDVVYGVVVSGRPEDLAGIEKRVGMYINTMPLHSTLQPGQSIAAWLNKIQEEQIHSRQYQFTPLQDIQLLTGVSGDLFDTILVFENYPVSKIVAEKKWSLNVQNVYMKEQSNYPLTITVGLADQLNIGFKFNTLLLQDSIVEMIVGHFEHVLMQLSQDSTELVSGINILTNFEERQLLESFNNHSSSYPAKNIVELFEQQAIMNPGNTAILFGRQQLTYRELNEKSNQLAHYLRSKGVKEQSLVPVLMERRMEMMIGILGILKAGAAYVPIDAAYPSNRVDFILRDINATTIITTRDNRNKVPSVFKLDIIDVDTDDLEISRHPVTGLSTLTSQDSLAYVIYTSGSTGTPKGVLVNQKNVVSLVKGTNYVSLDNTDTLLSTGSSSFDATTFEYWGMLLNGGKLVICTENELLDNKHLKAILRIAGVNKIWFTSSWFNQLVDADISIFETLKVILVGGEKLSEYHVMKLRQTYPLIEIINGYGPTENTTFSLTYHIRENEVNGASIPIGKPVSNRTAFVLGSSGQLLPIGVSGEICVGGDGLSNGYLNQPELTAAKFVKHPFSTSPGERIYKTGDLGRWLPDGNIEYLGRLDEQVKIRGYRIEPGEIEAVLLQSELVSQAVVLALDDNIGNKRLVAFIIPTNKNNKEAIFAHLRSQLPEYMVPALLVELDHMPLTANGKIDKAALPDPSAAQLSITHYEAPRNELEAKLADIWRELLGIPTPGIHDNFFELGGHSLHAVRLVSIIKRKMEVDITVNKVFIYPTIAGLINNYIEKIKNPSLADLNIKYLVPVKASGDNVPLYIVAGGGGTALRFKKFGELLSPEQPVYVLQPPIDSKDIKEFPDTIEGIAARFIEEMSIHNPHGPFALSGHCLGGIIAFEMARQLEAAGKEVRLLALFDTVIRKLAKRKPATIRNLYHVPLLIKKTYSKLVLKVDFETFLLRKHTRQSIRYKVDSVRSLIKKIRHNPAEATELQFQGLEIFDESADIYVAATKKYKLFPFKGNMVVFYAKEHYLFLDKSKNVGFKKLQLDEKTKNIWNQYAKEVSIHEIDGEHSEIFDPVNGVAFANLLQQYLDKS